MSGKKSSSFDEEGIDTLSNNKPIVYEIKDKNGKTRYIGSSKRGRGQDRLKEHLPDGKDPIPGGATVNIKEYSSIQDAQDAEDRAIKRKQPSNNKKGK